MRQAPEMKQTKGFASKKDEEKKNSFFAKPTTVSRPGTTQNVRGQKRRAGLSFSGSIQRPRAAEGEARKAGGDIVMMDGPSEREAPRARSNADFKAMFFHQ
jgi:hypothetical protein